jgi:hypothetical protein
VPPRILRTTGAAGPRSGAVPLSLRTTGAGGAGAGGSIMERFVNRNNTYIRQKLDKNKPFFCSINGINYKLLLLLKPLNNKKK